ncbi:MAG: potassium transporter KefB [Syntrophomonadaceae bacterium]|jgi:CPA2 family monovalent cation:H+ antiporter-2|nr:potassium transporter KefB [Syntrophomonadaceae bacterium]
MEIPLLNDIVLIFGLAIVVIYICHKINIPSVVGLLITGVLTGPHGFGMVNNVESVDALAELGIILLLFTIGIEFSLRQLLQIKKSVFLGGALQVVFTSLAAMLIMMEIGYAWNVSLFIGFLVSLSSTAIVLKLIQDRSEIDSPHGRNILGILIFQDIVIIPMMLLTPLLANTAGGGGESVILLLFEISLVLLFLYLGARWIAPFVFHHIARQQSRELFLLSTVTMGLAVAWLTSSIGLSLSLGAFLAGLILSESDYNHQALVSILPFRDVFTSLFFVSVGMLFSVHTFMKNPLILIGAALLILLVKAVVAGGVVVSLGFPIRTAILAGLALNQVGEFSFILSRVGLDYQLLSPEFYELFIIVSVLTMAVTPFSIAVSPRIAQAFLRLPLPAKIKTGMDVDLESPRESLNDHLVIIGFGINGRNLARVAAATGIPYMIIEMNPDVVRKERENGEPIFFGDAIHLEVLQQANIDSARVVVVAISDASATTRIVDLIHKTNPQVHIIVRTRYLQDIQGLYDLGANDVIPEEFETSIEIFTLVLKKYLVPKVDIERFIDEVRQDGYQMLRSLSGKSPTFQDIKLHCYDAEIANLRVESGAFLAGKTLGEADLRNQYGVSILLIQRGADTIINPGADVTLEAGDQAVLLGTPDRIKAMTQLLGGSFRRNRMEAPSRDEVSRGGDVA